MIKAIIIRQRNRLLTLLGAVGCGLTLLSSCANYDNLDFVPVTGEVKHTQLALSASGSNATTRASSAITQADEQANGSHFRGISDLYLLPFQITNTTREYIGGNDTPSGSQVVAGDNAIPSIYNGANSKYYLDVVIPVGTNAFLVYGRATGSNSSLTDKQTNGVLAHEGLTSTVGTTPAGITFSPVPMVDSNTSWTTRDAIITYLNSIFNKDWADATNHSTLNGLYDMVKNMKAGSYASVLAFVQEIYDALKGSSGTDVENVLKAILSEENLPSPLPDKVTLPSEWVGYPTTDNGLPDGAAVIEWKETIENNVLTKGEFVAVTDKNNLGAMNVDVTAFAFPAELYYRANSRIHTSEVELTDVNTQAPAIFNRTAWGNLESDDNTSVLKQQVSGNNLFTPDGMVYNTTTIVAITDPLQYAVSRLDVRLEAKDVNTTLEKLVDIAGTEFDITNLPITGILVGQQSPVDYLFQSKWEQDGDHPLYTIYDSAIEGAINAKDDHDADVYTHTLVLETAKDQTVNVAIELLNNSGESILTRVPGDTEDQIIPNGCKFYLVGQLIPTAQDGYVEDGENWQNRVFCQDNVTQVTFTVKDLTKAYYVIPPLSNVELEFSLGVLDWKLSTPSSTILK